MAKHTTGPWAIAEQNDSEKSWKFEVYSIVTNTGVARVGYFDTERAEDHANARLIAAAPELLAALEALAAICDESAFTQGPALRAAFSAIAKARGK